MVFFGSLIFYNNNKKHSENVYIYVYFILDINLSVQFVSYIILTQMELKQYICRIIQDDTNILLIKIHLLFKEINHSY